MLDVWQNKNPFQAHQSIQSQQPLASLTKYLLLQIYTILTIQLLPAAYKSKHGSCTHKMLHLHEIVSAEASFERKDSCHNGPSSQNPKESAIHYRVCREIRTPVYQSIEQNLKLHNPL